MLLLATLMLPGLAVGAAAGLRGWLLVGASPLLSYGVVAVAAPVVPLAFGHWSVGGLALSVLILGLALLGVRLLARLKTGTLEVPHSVGIRWRPLHHFAVAVAVLATTVLGLYTVGQATNGFTAIHQFWDAMFHANAVRFIADTGQSDPSWMRNIGPADGTFFYPNAFHVHVATTVGIDGGRLVDVLNLRAGLTAGLLSLSMVALVRHTVGRPALAFAVAALCGAFSAFPHDLAFYGPLWPFAAGLVLLPAFMALVVAAMHNPHPATVGATALGLIALAAVHPSIALAAVVIALAFVVQRWLTLRKLPLRDVAVLLGSGALAGIYLLPVAAISSKIVGAYPPDHPAITTGEDALFQLVSLQHEAVVPQLWLVAAMIVGALGIWYLRALWWWLASGTIFAALFVLAAAAEGRLVELLTNPWWNDRWRLIALATPALILLAANGLVVARDLVVELPLLVAKRAPVHPNPRLRAAALGVVILGFAVVTEGLYAARNTARVAHAYDGYPTLGAQEQQALAELARLTPPDAVIMNDSNDGSAWVWALHDRQPVFGHALPIDERSLQTNLSGVDADRALLYNRFDELDVDAQVSQIIRRLHISYVVVGDGFASPSSRRAPGLDNLADVRGLTLVYANEDSMIYRVDLAGGAEPEQAGSLRQPPDTLGS